MAVCGYDAHRIQSVDPLKFARTHVLYAKLHEMKMDRFVVAHSSLRAHSLALSKHRS